MFEDISNVEPDERQRERIKKAKRYVDLFESELGKQVLSDLRKEFFYDHFRSTVFRAGNGSVDPYGTLFNDGCREVIQHIHGMIEIGKQTEDVRRGSITLKEPDTETMLGSMDR